MVRKLHPINRSKEYISKKVQSTQEGLQAYRFNVDKKVATAGVILASLSLAASVDGLGSTLAEQHAAKKQTLSEKAQESKPSPHAIEGILGVCGLGTSAIVLFLGLTEEVKRREPLAMAAELPQEAVISVPFEHQTPAPHINRPLPEAA